MVNHVHHAHLFASNLDRSLKFYQEMFGGSVVFDLNMAGARNVFLKIGRGGLNFYDKCPPDTGKGAVHHIGIQTDDLEGLVAHMKARGASFRKEITDLGFWKYVMFRGPDHVLLELFQVIPEKIPDDAREKLRGFDIFQQR